MKKILSKKIQFIPGLGEKPWEYKNLSKYLDILDIDWNTGRTKTCIKKTNILSGFSMGAALACEYTLKNKVKNLILCSLTPGEETLKEVNADNVVFLVGEKEKWVLKEIKRVRKTLLCKSSIVVIPKADHKIIGKYQEELIKIVNSLNANNL